MSLVYVMVCLIIIGFTATALIKMSHKNSINQIHYSQSESARLAVQSGFEKALAFFEHGSDSAVLGLLQEWIDKPVDNISTEHRWLLGSGTQYDTLDSQSKFRVQMLGFDPKNFAVALYSEGEENTGHKASAYGTYSLKGLGYKTIDANIPPNAIQMDNGAFEINVNMEIFGNSSLKAGMTINTDFLKFHGTFRYDSLPSGEIDSLILNTSTTFDSLAYFAGKIASYPPVYFKRSAGFRGLFQVPPPRANFGIDPSGNDNLYIFAGGSNNCYFYGKYNLKNNRLERYNRRAKYKSKFKNYIGSGTVSNNDVDIPLSIGLNSEPDPEIHFNYKAVLAPQFTPHFTFSSINDKLTGKKMNQLYDGNKDNLWNGFLVIHIPAHLSNQWFSPFETSEEDEDFTGKTIIICESKKAEITNFYESTNDAITAFFVTNVNTNNRNFVGLKKFRGFLYIDKVKADYFVYQPEEPYAEFIGSVYGSPNGRFKFDGGTDYTTIVRYNEELLTTIAKTGILTHPDSSNSSTTSTTLVKTQERIQTELLSRSF